MSLAARTIVAGGMIDGAFVRELVVHEDERGSFTEFYSRDRDEMSPAQWSVVSSGAGVLRGMHLHRRHDEGFLLLKGRAFVGLRDLRRGSPTEGVSTLFEFSGESPVYLTFPRGIVHGWLFHEPSIHLQSVSETYGEYGDDDNLGCHWSDPALEIPWPAKPTVVAARASGFGNLAALIDDTLRIDPDFRY
jgi:dTDP-4-dehydrorhamnose 3,5-epimerase